MVVLYTTKLARAQRNASFFHPDRTLDGGGHDIQVDACRTVLPVHIVGYLMCLTEWPILPAMTTNLEQLTNLACISLDQRQKGEE
jgi:hypothetical protein